MRFYTVLLYTAVGLAQTRGQVITVTVCNYLWPSLTLLFAVPILGWRARPLVLFSGTLLWDTAARRGNLPLVAAFSYLTPLLSVLVSSLYLQLPVPPHQWLAGGLVVAGAVLCKASVTASAHVTARPTDGGRGRGERPAAGPGAPPSSAD